MTIGEFIAQARARGISRLMAETGLSRSHLYGILNGRTDPSLGTVRKIAVALGLEIKIEKPETARINEGLLENESYIIWNLARHDAPLLTQEAFEVPLDVNMTALRAIEIGRKNAQINTVLPYFLFKKWRELDWKYLLNKISDKRYLAYLLDLIVYLTNNTEFFEILGQLRSKLGEMKPERLIKRGRISRFEKRRLQSAENSIADRWKYQTADSLQGIAERFRKWKGEER